MSGITSTTSEKYFQGLLDQKQNDDFISDLKAIKNIDLEKNDALGFRKDNLRVARFEGGPSIFRKASYYVDPYQCSEIAVLWAQKAKGSTIDLSEVINKFSDFAKFYEKKIDQLEKTDLLTTTFSSIAYNYKFAAEKLTKIKDEYDSIINEQKLKQKAENLEAIKKTEDLKKTAELNKKEQLISDPFADDYYKRLGLPSNASHEKIQKAYKKLCLQWHPDKNSEIQKATSAFQNIQEAYTTLNDPSTRNAYHLNKKRIN